MRTKQKKIIYKNTQKVRQMKKLRKKMDEETQKKVLVVISAIGLLINVCIMSLSYFVSMVNIVILMILLVFLSSHNEPKT